VDMIHNIRTLALVTARLQPQHRAPLSFEKAFAQVQFSMQRRNTGGLP